ncbi:MAG: flavodoxin reductase [Chitinophagales bacterium]|nr:FAD-binding oxidoreductase [Chitinophagales bacterium]MCZ2393228.1 flavodoxin reductase [Chitinophagales bacterium]
MSHIVKIKSIKHLTHDILQIELNKPKGLQFHPGQAVDFAINEPGWEKEWRSFTFTSLPEDENIEFNIKTYPSHNGVTNRLLSKRIGDEILIGDVYGDIAYKGEGIFIAGGAGYTPFAAILKDLHQKGLLKNNKFIFANKTVADIALKNEFEQLLDKNFINVLSDEKVEGYEHGFVTAEIIKKQIEGHQYFYLCGPPPMMDAVGKQLASLGINDEHIVKEGF